MFLHGVENVFWRIGELRFYVTLRLAHNNIKSQIHNPDIAHIIHK